MEYYIQGDAANAQQIKAAFEKILGRIVDLPFEKESVFFYTVNIRGKSCIRTFDTTYYLVDIIKTHPDYKELPLSVQPKFKAGDNIKTGNQIDTIAEIDNFSQRYYCESGRTISFANQDLWKLDTKPHYDISNFHAGMPVLVRADNVCRWNYSVFSHITGNKDWLFAVCNGVSFTQCIPFDGNEHLLGTTDMCDEQYINWQGL